MCSVYLGFSKKMNALSFIFSLSAIKYGKTPLNNLQLAMQLLNYMQNFSSKLHCTIETVNPVRKSILFNSGTLKDT